MESNLSSLPAATNILQLKNEISEISDSVEGFNSRPFIAGHSIGEMEDTSVEDGHSDTWHKGR